MTNTPQNAYQIISSKPGVNVIHCIVYLTTSAQGMSSQFVNHPMLPNALPVFADHHQQNVKSLGSYNWTTQQLWAATLILPTASRCFQIGWMQCYVLSGALRLLHWCSSMLQKLWNTIQEYPEQCIVEFKKLQNYTIRMYKFSSNWEEWPHPQDYSSEFWTWSHTPQEWLL